MKRSYQNRLFANRRTSFSQPSLGKSVYCYSKTNTNMFVIECGLILREPKVLGFGNFSRQGAKFGEENILANDFHHSFRPLRPLRLCERYSEFRLRLFADRRTSFSQPSLGKSVYYYSCKFARLAQIFRKSKTLGFGYSSRQACPESHRRGAKTLSSDLLSFRPQGEIFLRSLAFPRDDGLRPVTFAP